MMHRNSLIILSFFVILGLSSACKSDKEGRRSGTNTYQKAVSDFYLSLAAIQTDQASFAFNKMKEVAEAYPDEPAVWANLGVYAMRQGNYEMASEHLEKARNLAPDNPDIKFLSALIERNRRNIDASISYLNDIQESDTVHVRAQFLLANLLEQQDFEANKDEINEIMATLSEQLPHNQALILERIRLKTKQGNSNQAQKLLNELGHQSESWRDEQQKQFEKVNQLFDNDESSELRLQLALLENQLKSNPIYQKQVEKLKLPDNQVGFLISEFINLPQPDVSTAPPDTAMTFKKTKAGELFNNDIQFLQSFVFNEQTPPLVTAVSDGRIYVDTSAVMDFPGTSENIPANSALATLDYNYDFRNDLAAAGAEGLRLFEQQDNMTFDDVTNTLALPASIINQSYQHVWTADLDLDGDLDILLSSTNGSIVTLRNNGDNTFSTLSLFQDIQSASDFRWADIDGDLDPDAIFVQQNGSLVIMKNERSGVFEKVENEVMLDFNQTKSFTVADIDADSRLDIIALNSDKSIRQFSFNEETQRWKSKDLGQIYKVSSNRYYLYVQDIDNNGSLDILLGNKETAALLLGTDSSQFIPRKTEVNGYITSVVDMDGDRRLDLVGINNSNEGIQFINSGTAGYNARSIRTRASDDSGDRRINSFAIGGQLEMRSGLLYQKHPITSPIVHFGLGNHEDTQMLRIIWPNGSVQAEFAELGIGKTIFNKQLLKGSCPWLFTHNGESYEFVTDVLWRSPLGLRINAQETAGVVQTKDRVKIPGEKLAEKDGVYNLRITAELWETHFFDMVDVIAVDHPKGTEMHLDERFSIPPPDLYPRLTGPSHPVDRVLNEQQQDVTDKIVNRDQEYLKPFNQTKFQGVVDEHHIVIEIGDQAPFEGPLWLLGFGWVRPTDSSINYAISQGQNPFPKGLKIEAASGDESWHTLNKDYGFPAGKTKTVMVDLTDVFNHNENRRVRFTTTTEIYWDAIHWAEGKPGAEIINQPLTPVQMDLAYRGYSTWNKKSRYDPLLPNYNRLSGATPRWQDLIGYYTRFGPVHELLKSIDDRYVIMNAGDEIKLSFKAESPVKDGYERDFILVTDGWIKDGDMNTRNSKTVWPLPSHGLKKYDTNYERLSDDPVYQRHKEDWINYHTRYVGTETFQKAVQNLTP